MERRNIGGLGGLEVSLVGLGCNAFGSRVDEKGTHAVIDAAIEAGVDFLDTAEIYGGGNSEVFIGSGLKRKARENISRNQICSRQFTCRRDHSRRQIRRWRTPGSRRRMISPYTTFNHSSQSRHWQALDYSGFRGSSSDCNDRQMLRSCGRTI